MSERRVERPVRPEDLPAMQQGLLDDDALAALERDLHACATVTEVRIKDAGQAVASERAITMSEAVQALRRGDASGVQIHYRYKGEAWCDTLMRTDRGVRLVRIRAFQAEEPD